MAGVEDQPAPVRARPREALSPPSDRSAGGPPSISDWTIAHPWTTVVLWGVLSVVGALAFANLKLALFPDISAPVVVVTARSDKLDPSANEAAVTNPLEAAFSGITGITALHSLTYPQFVSVDMQFDVTKSLAERKDDVAAAVARANLPAHVTTTIATEDLNEVPVATYALIDPKRSLADLTAAAAATIAPTLRAIPGALRVDVTGNPAAKSPSAYRYDGTPAIAVSVVKRADANTLEVARDVDDAVAKLRAGHRDLRIELTSTQAPYIREATQATQEALGFAILLAIIVIWPFLRDVRATLVSAIAIPVSLLGTACVMWLAHFNLETITLLALALVVGVIVDDAIVAVENIVRHLEAGEEAKSAARAGNKEIGLTLVAATLTIVAVFLPIGLMQGSLGRFFRAFGVTASAAVLFSLLAARTLSPALAAWWLRPSPRPDAGAPLDTNRTGVHPRYRSLIAWSLRHRAIVIGAALLAFAAGLALIPFIPKGFEPHLDRGEFVVDFNTPLGTEIAETSGVAEQLEKSIRTDPDVTDTFTVIGARSGQSNAGSIDVKLRRDRSRKTIDVEDAVRDKLPAIDGVVTTVADVPFIGTDTNKPFQIALLDDNLDELRKAGRSFEHVLQHTAGFYDVSASGLSDGTPFSAIERVNRHRAVQITAELASNLQIGDANSKVSALATKLPKGVTPSFGGNSKDVVTTFTDFGIALALSVVAILVVLFALFRTWIDPLAIIVSLPLSIVGALFALWVTRAEFGLISLMAVIFLFGLVNKNAILLVDRIEKLRRLGFERGDAIEEAGAQRLRPIVMTTAATILGMVPIALGLGAGAELRAPMAVAIIGGLITSTVLSLVVVPVAYTLFDDAGRTVRRRKPVTA